MNNSQVAHVWAQQTKPHGKGSSFYFDGPTIYSYGPHFPIARFVERAGRKAVLFTTRTYSVVTSAHISAVRSALYGLGHRGEPVPVFSVHNPADVPQSSQVRADYAQRVDALAQTAARSRKYGESTIERAQALAMQANVCAQFFGWKWRIPLPTVTPELIEKCRAAQAKDREANKAREAQRKAREAAQAIKDLETAEAWLAGADVSYPYRGYGRPETATRLRLVWRGAEATSSEDSPKTREQIVQTSRGAEVPAAHARRLWPIIQRVIKTGTPYQRNGHTEHVGEFAVDRIDADGTLVAGCHTIAYSELQKLAVALGLS